MNDLMVHDEGSIFLLVAITPSGQLWMDENLPEDAMRWGGATVIEHRYIEAIVTGAVADGLNVGER